MKTQIEKLTATIFNDGTVLYNFFRDDGKLYRTYTRDNKHKMGKIMESLSYSPDNTSHFQVDTGSVFVSVKFR